MNGDGTRSLRTILVGIDGSQESSHAGDFAGALASATGAKVVAVHACGLLDVWPDDPHPGGARNSHQRVRDLSSTVWTDPLRAHGVQPEIVLRDGTPAHVLLAVADEFDVDVIVVGSRGVGEADPYGLGSTATRVVHHSARPVTVVPNAAVRRPAAADAPTTGSSAPSA